MPTPEGLTRFTHPSAAARRINHFDRSPHVRIMFSGVPAYGHLLPLVPLASAAVRTGHDVAVLTGPDAATIVASEFPAGVQHLPAGPEAMEFIEEVGNRTGVDPLRPPPSVIAEAFGGIRLDLGLPDVLEHGVPWKPDLVVAESWDSLGPAVAAACDVSLAVIGVGPLPPPEIRDPLTAAAQSRHDAAGLSSAQVAALVLSWPEQLELVDPPAGMLVLPVQAQAHRRADATTFPDLPAGRPRVLVTLGTVFSAPAVVSSIVAAVAALDVEVQVTTGMLLNEQQVAADTEAGAPRPANVRYHSFIPLDDLLGASDVVIAAGGSGTIQAALVHGVPLVIWPQGTDQPINAAAATGAGVAVTVGAAQEIGPAVQRVLTDGAFRTNAQTVAAGIRARPPVAEVLSQLVALADPHRVE